MEELISLSLAEMMNALRDREFSSCDLTSAFIQRIENIEPLIKAFITFTPEDALAQAQKADTQIKQWWKHGRASELPPLTGIPVAVKDVLCVEGIRCTSGSRILENFVPPYSATAVKRAMHTGAVILGKTNTDEFAMGSSTENSAYGTTHNPWDLSRVPGGSSGGSAAAVAARMSPIALGTDTGGSVRQPASFCGVTGIKPSYGRVSRYGLIAYGSSLDVVGGFGRSAQDAAVLYGSIAGYDPLDATCIDQTVPEIRFDPEIDLRGQRIGVPDEYFIKGLKDSVKDAVCKALEKFEDLGADIQTVNLPHTEYALPVYYIIAPAEASANLARFDGIRYGPRVTAEEIGDIYKRTRGEKFGREVKRRIMLGTYALSAGYYDAYYNQAQKVRTLIKQDFETAFERVDLIAAPVAPTTAFLIGQHKGDPLSMYLEDIFTLPANLAGIPGISFPVGFDPDGLPIGMQLMGRHFEEPILFKAAHAYQMVTEWHKRQPVL